MKSVSIVADKAKMVDDNGKSFTAQKEGTLWIVDGKGYKNPFDAFKAIERNKEDDNEME